MNDDRSALQKVKKLCENWCFAIVAGGDISFVIRSFLVHMLLLSHRISSHHNVNRRVRIILFAILVNIKWAHDFFGP